MGKKNGQDGGSAGTDLALLETLPTLSKEQLLEIAKEKGIEVDPEGESEVIAKAITDFVVSSAEKGDGDKGSKPPATNPDDGEGVVIVSKQRAGKTISAVTGTPITFDKDGKATVNQKDAEYLVGIPGFEKA